MRVEAAVVANMVELDQVIRHGCALHGTSKTTLRGSASRRAKRNKVLCDEEAAMNALIAHIVFDSATGTYKPGNSGLEEFEATLIPFSPCLDPRWIRDIPATHSTRLKINPDCGATIWLGGLTYLRQMGLSESNLVLSKKKVGTVGGFSLIYQGWLPVTFKIGSRITKQALYTTSNIFQQGSLY